MITLTAEYVARALGGARRNGDNWLCRCPVLSHGRGRGDQNPSLSLRDGEGGQLLVHCFAGCDPRDVLHELRIQGLTRGSVGDFQPRPVKPSLPKTADQDAIGRSMAARKVWQLAGPATGTAVEAYLRARAITCPIPPTIRFHPALKHHPTGTTWPAMVSAVQGPDGAITAIHRTYLERDGKGKAPVESPKMSLGTLTGGGVRMGLPCDGLLISEGIENGLTGMQALGRAVWAALSTSGLKWLVLPPVVREVTILADGDAPGENAANVAAERWTAEGRTVRIAPAPRGQDFNDLLREEAG